MKKFDISIMKNIIGSNIAKFRKQLGLSQYDLAEKTGLSRRAIAYYETGTNNDFFCKLKKIANVLNVSISDIVDEKQNKNSSKDDIAKLDTRLVKKVLQIKKLPPRSQDAVWKYINFIEQNNTSKRSN